MADKQNTKPNATLNDVAGELYEIKVLLAQQQRMLRTGGIIVLSVFGVVLVLGMVGSIFQQMKIDQERGAAAFQENR